MTVACTPGLRAWAAPGMLARVDNLLGNALRYARAHRTAPNPWWTTVPKGPRLHRRA
jgi:hypothetical protein